MPLTYRAAAPHQEAQHGGEGREEQVTICVTHKEHLDVIQVFKMSMKVVEMIINTLLTIIVTTKGTTKLTILFVVLVTLVPSVGASGILQTGSLSTGNAITTALAAVSVVPLITTSKKTKTKTAKADNNSIKNKKRNINNKKRRKID